jgi:hypothetical protein
MKYLILRPVVPPRICFLWEAVNWRAFGNYPTGYWGYYGKDTREFPEDPEMFEPPAPDDPGELSYLSEAQTKFAGLPPDPSLFDLGDEREDSDLEHYDRLLNIVRESNNFDKSEIEELLEKRRQAEEFWNEYNTWRALHDAYIDQFQTELLLALRKGQVAAFGRKLPRPDRERTERLFDRLGRYTNDIEPEQIPKELWVSNFVNWRESSLTSPTTAFVWINIAVESLLQIFPPTEMIPAEKVSQIGDCFAVDQRAFTGRKQPNETGARGRPSLPWEDFYVELARLYRDREMPSKKEAAIQHFQTWFKEELGLQASRSAIGQKLKPFFDRLSET